MAHPTEAADRRELLDDALMTSGQLGRSPGRPLRTAAVGGLAFTVLYLLHRILQGVGPDKAAPPIVWTITALVAVLSLAIQRTGLVWRWLGGVGLVAAAIFLLGSVFSVLGRTPEGSSSLLGVGLFMVWMLLLSAGLWRTAASSTP